LPRPPVRPVERHLAGLEGVEAVDREDLRTPEQAWEVRGESMEDVQVPEREPRPRILERTVGKAWVIEAREETTAAKARQLVAADDAKIRRRRLKKAVQEPVGINPRPTRAGL